MIDKGCLLTLFIFLFSNSFAALPDENVQDGADSSGGGVAVVCKNSDDSIKSVEMLDLYEGRIVYSLNIQQQGTDYQGNVAAVSEKLKVIFKDLKLKKDPASLILKAQKDMKLIQGEVSIAPVNDANFIIIPNDCDLTQIAYYKNNSILLVNANLWDKMDDLNKAALIVHEAVYLHERELGDRKSRYSRKVVAHLFSDYSFESLSVDIPQSANECFAHHKDDSGDIAFKFFKFVDPTDSATEILQFTKFRGKYPYSVTQVFTPLWPWPKEDGDLYLDVNAPIELYDQLYLRRRASSSGNEYYFDEARGDYLIKCGKAANTQVRPAVLTISGGPTYDFGTQAGGSSTHRTFTITNSGFTFAKQLNGVGLAAPFAFYGGSYPGKAGTCGSVLAAASSCTVVIAFSPNNVGVQVDTLEIEYYDGNSFQTTTRSLQGTSVSPALLTISDGPSVNFGVVSVGNSSSAKSITIINTGAITATQMSEYGLSAPFGFAGGAYPGAGGTCGASLAAGGSCVVMVVFAPKMGNGTYTDSIAIRYNNGASDAVSNRDVIGIVGKPAELIIAGEDIINLGAVFIGDLKTIEIIIENTGELEATKIIPTGGFSAPFHYYGGSYPGKGGTCGTKLQVGQSCKLAIAFIPQSPGDYSETLALSYYDGASKKIVLQYFEATAKK